MRDLFLSDILIDLAVVVTRWERGRDRLAGQLVVDVLAQVLDAAGNNAVNCDAQANDGCGQNNPVNSYCAGFVVAESFCKLEEFHNLGPS